MRTSVLTIFVVQSSSRPSVINVRIRFTINTADIKLAATITNKCNLHKHKIIIYKLQFKAAKCISEISPVEIGVLVLLAHNKIALKKMFPTKQNKYIPRITLSAAV